MHKLYNSGKEFLSENIDVIKKYPMETAFFELDAFFDEVDNETYALRVWQGDCFLLALRLAPYPLMLFGEESLCGEAAQVFVEHGFRFNSTLSYPQIGERFLAEYEKLCGGRHEVKHAMDIMHCGSRTTACELSGVRWATPQDAECIARFAVDFAHEALGEAVDFETRLERVKGKIGSFAVLEMEGQIVSVAQRDRDMTAVCAICYVYTLPKYRNRGFSRKVVTFVTNSILQEGKTAYLFVDKTNPVSNHLYRKIGYEYSPVPQYEINYFLGGK